MKSIVLSLALLLVITLTGAQENNTELRTIFGSTEGKSHGGYGAVMINYSEIMDRDALLIGARGAWVVDHNFGIGLGGYGFMTDPQWDNVLNEEYQVSGGYGGILVEPIVGAKSPVHLSFPILIGAGGVAYNQHWQENEDNDYDDENYEDSDAFFVIEPGIELEFNMIKFMRMGLSVSYRYTSDINLSYRTSTLNKPNPNVIGSADMLRGFNFGLVMKFGKF
ncbi:hypothetical protein J1N10_18250 [Carboxylicivirga sp. A043]|uniref:hypothetical protein n=1 Tax=Carboxylicivirga litoralis TaxID=2816963 RepID=UPI0021CB718F|nr:hypothetical protein [Carboxylicivirga sp. A043]MCU4157921.1 hypothetical protein [Carboxylicivirga sp. A043]